MDDILRWALLGGFVIACIVLIVFLVLSAKSWRVLHILATLFVFAAAAFFAPSYALVWKTTAAWKDIAIRNAKQAEKAAVDVETLSYGAEAATFPEDSLVGVQAQFNRELIGRGRVWRGAQAQWQGASLADGSFVVTLAQPVADAAEGAAAPQVVTIDPQSPIFLFVEGELQSAANPALNGMLVPQLYLGEFLVTEQQGAQVRLTPTLAFFNPAEITGILPVVLYEKMPGDRHDVLVQQVTPDADPVATRQLLTTEIFPPAYFQLTPEQLDPASPTFNRPAAEAYERMIDEYQFDGMSVGQIATAIQALIQAGGRFKTEFDPAPDEQWIEVEFLQDYQVQVDAPNSGDDATDVRRGAVNRGFYDPKGLAIDADLRLESENGVVSFKAGDRVLVDKISAEDGYRDESDTPIAALIAEGVCKKVDVYFRRKLNDYQLSLTELNLAGWKLEREIEREVAENTTLAEAQTRTENQLELADAEQTKLRADVTNLSQDVALLEEHLAKLDALLAARQRRINQLFVQTQGLAQRKAELESELVRRIDAATADAVSSN